MQKTNKQTNNNCEKLKLNILLWNMFDSTSRITLQVATLLFSKSCRTVIRDIQDHSKCNDLRGKVYKTHGKAGKDVGSSTHSHSNHTLQTIKEKRASIQTGLDQECS